MDLKPPGFVAGRLECVVVDYSDGRFVSSTLAASLPSIFTF